MLVRARLPTFADTPSRRQRNSKLRFVFCYLTISTDMRSLAIVVLVNATLAFAQYQPPASTAPRNEMPPDTKAPAPRAQAEDAGAQRARALIHQAIQALGGQAYLTYTDVEQQGRTYGFSHGEPSGTGTQFWRFWKWPDKDRIELTKQRDWIVIHNGETGSEITFRGTAPEEKPALEDYLRRRYYSLEYVLRRWINEPGVAFFFEGQASAARKPAFQVSILNAKNEAVTLFLDQDNHLPLMKTFVWRDPETREKNEEAEIYDNYRTIQGIATPLSVTRQKNGMNTNQRFITAVAYNQGLEDALFDPKMASKPVKK